MTADTTHLDILDRSVEKANIWINEVATALDGNRHEAYRALRAYLHTLRDTLPAQQNARLAAQLPMLIRGLFYEGWQPGRTPLHYRDPVEFAERVRREAGLVSDTEAWFAVQAVADVLRRHVSAGEISHVVHALAAVAAGPGRLLTRSGLLRNAARDCPDDGHARRWWSRSLHRKRSTTMATIAEPRAYAAPGTDGQSGRAQGALRQLHRRCVGAADHGRLPRERLARDGPAVLRGGVVGAGRRRAGARRRARRQGRLGGALARRARRGARRGRRRDGGQPRDARRRRELRERQAGARDARRRHPAGDRPLPLLRGRGPRRGGADLRDRRADLRVPLPRAARRRRRRSSRSTSRC